MKAKDWAVAWVIASIAAVGFISSDALSPSGHWALGILVFTVAALTICAYEAGKQDGRKEQESHQKWSEEYAASKRRD